MVRLTPRSVPRCVVATRTSLVLTLLSLMLFSWVSAEGSRTLYPTGVGGQRAYLRTRDTSDAGSGSESRVKVFARAGETINLASSAQGVGAGSITWTAPDGTIGNCNGLAAGVGLIGTPGLGIGAAVQAANRTAELDGPGVGYIPCVVNVGTDGPAGVWIIDFDGPDTANGDNDPPNVAADGPWTQPALGDDADNTVAAWDVTVCPGVGPCNLTTEIIGRVYFNRFDGILDRNNRSLEVRFNILTNTGYQYTIDTNELDPFGFALFTNNKGIRDAAGNPTYISANAAGANIHDPEAPDDPTNITNKMFLSPPDMNMPPTAAIAGGNTWLYTNPIIPTASNLTFTGIEGTAGQTGTNPLSGTFEFNSGTFAGSYTVILDLNNNGTYGDGNDRLLSGNTSAAGINEIFWDGLDGAGTAVGATTAAINISAQVNLQAGQIHFPIEDAENSPGGMIISRVNGPGASAVTPVVSSYYNGVGLGGGTPPAPISCSHLPLATNPIANQPCDGSILQQWTGDWGNVRVVDTWAFTDVPPVVLSTAINIVEADLEIASKTAIPAEPVPGQTISYIVVVENNGPSGVRQATFRDVFPAGLNNIRFIGATTTGTAVSRAPLGPVAGNFTDTVDLANGATITYRFTAVVDAGLAVGDSLDNTASILRPADVRDPDATDPNAAVPTDVAAECTAAGFAGTCNNILVNTITLVADATPVAVDDSTTTPPDTPVTFSATNNDSDFDGNLDVSSVDLDPIAAGQQTTFTVPGEGTFTVDTNGDVTFTPVAGFGGTSSIPYTVSDTTTPTPLVSNEAALSVTIAAFGPRVRNDRDLDNPLGTEVILNVLANDRAGSFPIDPTTVDLDPRSPGIQTTFTTPGEGTYTVDNAGNVTFTPDAGFEDDPTPISYTVNDIRGATSNPASIFIGYAPEAVDDENSTPPDTNVTTNVLANDLGDIDPTTIQLVDPTTGNLDPDGFFIIAREGTYTLNPDGTITFDPDPTFTGVTSGIDYQVQDADGNTTRATLIITIQEPPVAVDDSERTSPDTPITVDVTVNDTDSDGTLVPTTVTLIPPAGSTVNLDGSITIAGEGTFSVDPATGEVTFDPEPGFLGESDIDYTVEDDDGNVSNVATLTIRVRVGPIARDDLSSGNTPGDSAVLDVLANDSTDDGTLEPTTIILFDPSGTPDPDGTVEIPGEGNYSLDPATGNVTFTPEAGFTADPTPISYTVNDSNGNVSNIATITVDYLPIASDDTSSANPPGPVSIDPLANDTTGDDTNPTTVNLTDPDATDSDGDGFNDSLIVPGEGEYSVDLLTGDVTFTPEPGFDDDPTPTTYTVQDAEGNLSNVATISIDYAPIASDDGAATSPNTPVTIPVLDNDTGDITDVTITLVPPAGVTPNPDGSVTIPGEGTYSVDPTTNEVTFDPAPGFDGISTIEYTLTDTEGNTSPPATITVTMQAIPLAIDDVSLDNPPGSTVTINPLINDVDSDGDLDPSTVNLTDPAAADTNGDGFNDVLIVPGQGAYSVNPVTGFVTFVPEPGFNSDPSPTTYTVQDEAGNVSNVATITIDYVPVATDDSATTDPGTPVTVPILDNDSGDISTPIITLVPPTGITPNPDGSVTIPDEGTYVVNPNGTVTFTPEPGFNGPSTIDYTLTDNEGNISNPATITVSPELGPVANDDTAVTPPDVPVTVDILENDSDPDGVIDPTTVVLLDPVTGNPDPDGTVTIPGEGTYTVDPVTGEVTFDPVPGFTGDSSIPYLVSDDDGNISNPATLTVTVGTGPIPPIANDDTAETPAGIPVTIPLTANDTDSDGTIDVTTVTLLDPVTGTPVTTLTVPGEGTYVVNPDGSVTFDPVGGFSSLVTPITYVVEDNDGNLSNPATLTINVLPDARDNNTTTPAETPISINVLGNDTGTLLPSSVTPSSTPSNGSVSVDNDPTSPTFGQIVYTPNPGFSGEDTFTYTAVDQDGNPVEATVTITVLPEADDDVQVVPPDAPVTFTVDDLLENDLGDLDPTTFTIVTPPSDGTLSFDPLTGELVFTPAPNFDGTDSFVYEICDTAGNCVTATVQLVSLPAAIDDEASTPVNTPVTVPVVDNDIPLTSFDLTTLTVADGTNGLQPPSNGSVVVNPNGTITYTPEADFSGTDTFTYEICDPSADEPCRTAEVTVTVLPEADDDSSQTPAGTPVTLPLLDNDNGSLDPTTVSIASPPTNGTLFINPDGSVVYTPLPGFSGEDSFAYEVCDTEGNCTSAVASITVLPQAVDDTVPVPLDTPVVIPVLDNDNGDLDPTTVSIVTPPDNGTVTVDPVTGEITYTPDPGFSGDDSFDYEVCDVNGNCSTATVTVSVSEGDLLAIDDAELTDFDTPVTIPVLSNDIPGTAPLDPTSIDLDPSTPGQQTEVETPEGTFVANSDGTVTFTPVAGFIGIADVPYTMSDVTGTTSNVATITVNVVPPGQADVSISKTIVSVPVVAGDVVTFQLIVSNSGPAAATNVTITDVVPDDIEDPEVSLDSGASFDPWTGSLNIGTLAAGERIILLIRGTLADDAVGILSNTATVTADQDDPNPDDNSDTATADIVPPDAVGQLGVAKALGNITVNPDNGSFEVTFDFVVENLGNVTATDIQLTDDLATAFGAGNFEVISLTSSNLSVNPSFNGNSDINLLTGDDSLAPGEQASAILQVRVFEAGSYQNSALVTAQDPLGNPLTDTSTAGLDPDPDGNGDPTDNDDATQVDLSPPGPLTALLQKEAATGNYAIGDVIDYTLTVTNPSGNGEALVVTLRDTPPPATSYVEDSGTLRIGETSELLEPTITDGQLVWSGIVLDIGETLTLSYQLRVLPGAASPLENRAIVDAVGETSGRDVTSDEQSVEVALEDGPFSLDISLLTGQVYIDTNQNGRFENETDTPLPGARVILANGWQTTTDVQGNYVFRDVPSGVTSVLLDAQTAPYAPLPHPEATADPYQHRVRIQGVSVSDFPLAPRAGLITVSRETTLTAGPLTLTKQLVPLPEGVRVVLNLQTTDPISNLVIIDPVSDADDQRFEIDELDGSQTLTYDLPEQVPLTDPQLIWSDQ